MDDSDLANAVTLVPVPEPHAYAMLLAGLCLLAWVIHRRKSRA
ncbi:MAG: PEP-CTERM sorting domain-containing protein [Thiobacillaceae bacterium]